MSKIRFCPKCDNNFSNYNLETNEKGELNLYYKCGSCLYVEYIPSGKLEEHSLLYTKTNLNRKPDRIIHIDLCDDPTLPRSSNIPCPNNKCPSYDDKNNEVVFFNYNEERKIAFICCRCHNTWK
jgi:DNA-directed RNA polymerase subunit M/transcription elongation factor TFIIS